MRRNEPSGAPHRPEAYVFGNEVGERVNSMKRAWKAACRRAGIVGLHFHDLRREAGSRMLEGGVPEHVVQRMLGHANLATTSRYLKPHRRVMHDAIQRYAERLTQDATETGARCKIVASDEHLVESSLDPARQPSASKSLQ